MQTTTAKRVLILIIAVFCVSLIVGCSGMEKRPAYRSGYLTYPTELVQADQALDEARTAGKDKQCPEEFNAAKDMVDKAYEVYMACHTQEAIDMAREALAKIKALCPALPTCQLTATPNSIEKGQSATLNLITSGAVKTAVLDGTEVAVTGGTQIVRPTSTTSYTAKVAGSSGSTTCNVTVGVTVPTPPPAKVAPQARVIDRLTIHVNFDFDKSKVRTTDEAELKKASDFVRKYPDAKVELEGHTDGKGTEQYNQKLSERRAEAVRQYLINEGAVDKTRISARGYGKSRPIAPNKTKEGKDNPEGRAENRRVEVLIISE
jgi:OmpA-OmpF porin, OOP family